MHSQNHIKSVISSFVESRVFPSEMKCVDRQRLIEVLDSLLKVTMKNTVFWNMTSSSLLRMFSEYMLPIYPNTQRRISYNSDLLCTLMHAFRMKK